MATEDDIGKLSAEFKKVGDDLKKFAEDAQKEIKQAGEMTAATKTEVDKLLAKHASIDGRLLEIEQKMARRGFEPETPKTLGEQVVADEKVKEFMENPRKGSVRATIKTKDITSAAASGGVLVTEDRRPGIIAPPDRRMTVRDLLTPGRTNSNLVEYLKENVFTNSAAVVSEGVTKPESNITFTEASAPVRTIAHWIRATRQILADAPMLQSYIDGRLRYGLAYAEELELLKGSGVGQHLNGIVTQATAYSAEFTPASATIIDTLRLAMLQVQLAEFPPSGIVLHPTDWARIELLKDGENRYLWANPRGMNGPGLWGLPVVTTQAMDEDEFLVGAFRLGAQIFDREDASVEISTEDQDNFVKNLVTILCEERLALAVYRTTAFVTGDFGNVT